MVARVLLSAGRVAISRPGNDVQFVPPTPFYLAMDSSFGPPERPLNFGFLFGLPALNSNFYGFGASYPAPPGLLVQTYVGGTTYDERYRYIVDSTQNYFTPYVVVVSADQFGIRGYGAGADSWQSIARNWIYSAWRTW
jgi:hypothetical protein